MFVESEALDKDFSSNRDAVLHYEKAMIYRMKKSFSQNENISFPIIVTKLMIDDFLMFSKIAFLNTC